MKLKDFTLTENLLKALGACQEAVSFVKHNNLIGFPLSRLDEVKGDYKEYVFWLKYKFIDIEFDKSENIVKISYYDSSIVELEYDKNKNIIKRQYSDGHWITYKYNEKNELVRSDSSTNDIGIYQYDDQGRIVKEIYNDGLEAFYTYNGNVIKKEWSDEFWEIKEYDDHGNEVLYINHEGKFIRTQFKYYNNDQLKQAGNMIIPQF